MDYGGSLERGDEQDQPFYSNDVPKMSVPSRYLCDTSDRPASLNSDVRTEMIPPPPERGVDPGATPPVKPETTAPDNAQPGLREPADFLPERDERHLQNGTQACLDRLADRGINEVAWKATAVLAGTFNPAGYLAVEAAYHAVNLIGALRGLNDGDGFLYKAKVYEIPGTMVGLAVTVRLGGHLRPGSDLGIRLDPDFAHGLRLPL